MQEHHSSTLSARNNPLVSHSETDSLFDMSASLKHPKSSKTSIYENCPGNKTENFTESQNNLGLEETLGGYPIQLLLRAEAVRSGCSGPCQG